MYVNCEERKLNEDTNAEDERGGDDDDDKANDDNEESIDQPNQSKRFAPVCFTCPAFFSLSIY